jgi:hypothetical protein
MHGKAGTVQRSVLHALVSSSLDAGQTSPPDPEDITLRFLKAWPPPHVLSQPDHASHSEIAQGTFLLQSQPLTSRND